MKAKQLKIEWYEQFAQVFVLENVALSIEALSAIYEMLVSLLNSNIVIQFKIEYMYFQGSLSYYISLMNCIHSEQHSIRGYFKLKLSYFVVISKIRRTETIFQNKFLSRFNGTHQISPRSGTTSKTSIIQTRFICSRGLANFLQT